LIAYICIVLSAAFGYLNGPLWTVVLAGVVLMVLSVTEQQKLRARLAAVGATEISMAAVLASLANAMVVSAGAFALGHLVRWLFPL
jgi:hypothetical protein